MPSTTAVRQSAAWMLGRLEAPSAIEPLIAALRDREYGVPENAAKALAQLGPIAVDPLIAALQDHDVAVRQAAATALRWLGWQPDRSEAATVYYIAVLQDEDSVVCRAADRILERVMHVERSVVCLDGQ